ncbi:cyclic lactone autoinducer peptide [Clostridium sp. Marseille-P2415]|nr:cyclic lactone autoinducer peptide [Clostridium sp. Marseille-P2415]
MMKEEKNLVAAIMEKVARKSVEMAADSRCMYVLHQPKQPEGVKNLKK